MEMHAWSYTDTFASCMAGGTAAGRSGPCSTTTTMTMEIDCGLQKMALRASYRNGVPARRRAVAPMRLQCRTQVVLLVQSTGVRNTSSTWTTLQTMWPFKALVGDQVQSQKTTRPSGPGVVHLPFVVGADFLDFGEYSNTGTIME